MSFPNDDPSNPQKPETRLVTAGQRHEGQNVDDLKADLKIAALRR